MLIGIFSIPIVLCSTITGMQVNAILNDYHVKMKTYGAFIILCCIIEYIPVLTRHGWELSSLILILHV